MPEATRRSCIHCGAIELWSEDGLSREWAVTLAMDPACDHETGPDRDRKRRELVAALVSSTVLDEERARAGVDLCETYGLDIAEAGKLIHCCLNSGLSLINVLSVSETLRQNPIRFFGIPQ